MRIEKNLYLVCKKSLFSLTLLCFALFISLGNLPRFFKSSLFSDHLLLSEMLLYFFALLSLFFIQKSKKSWLQLFCYSLLTILSFLYGTFLQEADLHAALYTFRLIAFFMTSYVLSALCFEKFQGSVTAFFSFLSNAYVISLLFGFFFYLVFPKASELWSLLSSYQVVFHGDPHIGRFVSVYFDPNYYACIAGIPFLISCFLYQKTKKNKHLILAFLFALSALLTWSRSGIVLLLGLLLWMVFTARKTLFSKKSIYAVVALSLLIVSGAFVFSEEFSVFFHRTFHLLEDDSALYRFYSFELGLSLLKEHPLFGIGYHFLYSYLTKETGLHSLDSSLLSLLVQIGALPFLALLTYGLYKIRIFPQMATLWKKQQKEAPLFLSWFLFYGLFTLFFASQFNNVLFYFFWILPFTVISLFLVKSIKQNSRS